MPLRTLDTLTLSGYPVLRGAADDADHGSQPSPTHSNGSTVASSADDKHSTPRTESFGFSTPSSASSAGRKPPAKDSMLESPQSVSDSCISPSKGRAQPNISHQFDEIRREDQRSIQLFNLPRHTTHQDIVDVARGGALVDVYIHWQTRSARVSFVQGSQAAPFKHHADLFGISIKGHPVSSNCFLLTYHQLTMRQVQIDWAQDQFQIYGALAKKIKFGATRVLVLRNAVGLIGEARIRDDMEHIHNLVIINVKPYGHDIVVECSSIYSAEFARTCMMSRNPYRNFKIESFPDHCAEELPPTRPARISASLPKAKPTPMSRNIYSVLAMDQDSEADE